MQLLEKFKSNKQYTSNISWQFGGKLLLMMLSFMVNIFVTRYLGASRLGDLQYVNSIFAFFGIFTYLGLNGILLNDLVSYPNKNELNITTVFVMKLIGGTIGFIIFILIMYFNYGRQSIEFSLSVIIGLTLLFKPFDTLSVFFDAKVKAKYKVISNSLSNIIVASYKVLIVIAGAGLIYFGSAVLLTSVISALIAIFFIINKFDLDFSKFKFSFSLAKSLFSKSWLLIFSSIFGVIYLKMDQVMLKWFKDSAEVGIYSVAVSLSEIWYFIPGIIVTTFTPRLISIRKKNKNTFKKKLQTGYDFLFLIAFSVSILISLMAHPVINLLYGSEFSESAYILQIHIWSGIFIFMRTLFSKWIIMENLFKYSLYTHAIGAIVNIVLNIFFIPYYGAIGAAIATLISYAFSSFIALFFFKNLREQAFMMSRAFTSFLRIKSLIKGF